MFATCALYQIYRVLLAETPFQGGRREGQMHAPIHHTGEGNVWRPAHSKTHTIPSFVFTEFFTEGFSEPFTDFTEYFTEVFTIVFMKYFNKYLTIFSLALGASGWAGLRWAGSPGQTPQTHRRALRGQFYVVYCLLTICF